MDEIVGCRDCPYKKVIEYKECDEWGCHHPTVLKHPYYPFGVYEMKRGKLPRPWIFSTICPEIMGGWYGFPSLEERYRVFVERVHDSYDKVLVQNIINGGNEEWENIERSQ